MNVLPRRDLNNTFPLALTVSSESPDGGKKGARMEGRGRGRERERDREREKSVRKGNIKGEKRKEREGKEGKDVEI